MVSCCKGMLTLFVDKKLPVNQFKVRFVSSDLSWNQLLHAFFGGVDKDIEVERALCTEAGIRWSEPTAIEGLYKPDRGNAMFPLGGSLNDPLSLTLTSYDEKRNALYDVCEPKYRAVEFSGDFTFKFYYGKRMFQKTLRLIATTDETASSDEYDDDTLLCKIEVEKVGEKA